MKSQEFFAAVSPNGDNEDGSGGEVARAFQTLICEAEGSKTAINLERLKSVINRFLPDFSDGKQHDAFEFFLQLFDILHEDLKSSSDDKSIISELFQSEIIAYRRFQCGQLDISHDQPSYLILPLSSNQLPVTFESCVSEWTRVEGFDTSNPLWCSKCGILEPFQMQVRVGKLSKYAVIQFLRFKHGPSSPPQERSTIH
jgi:ubiquitin C-terminal hydrolase